MAEMNKYRNIKVEVDGIPFASKREAKEYGLLKLKQKAGDFATFGWQIKFPIIVEGIKVCTYIADFVTYTEKGIIIDIIDVKGVKTPVYQLKKKLIKAKYGIDIIEL